MKRSSLFVICLTIATFIYVVAVGVSQKNEVVFLGFMLVVSLAFMAGVIYESCRDTSSSNTAKKVSKTLLFLALPLFLLSSFIYVPRESYYLWVVNGQIGTEGYLIRVPFKDNGWAGDVAVVRIEKKHGVIVHVPATTKDGMPVIGIVMAEFSLNPKEEEIKHLVTLYEDPDKEVRKNIEGCLTESFKKVVATKKLSELSNLILESEMSVSATRELTKTLGVNFQGSVEVSGLHGHFNLEK